jgi:hypothetical protein
MILGNRRSRGSFHDLDAIEYYRNYQKDEIENHSDKDAESEFLI